MDSNRKLSLPNGSTWKKSTSIALAALLIFSTAVVAWTIAPKNAYAAVSITSSSDKFFGSAFNRVLITDSALLGSPSDTISVIVEARRGSTSLGTQNANVNEIGTSGTFELFITTRSSGNPANPTNTSPNVFRIHSGGNISATLQDGDTIRITYGGTTKDLSFASTIASASVDRTSAGAENLVRLIINDPDGNNDPTIADSFNATAAGVSAIISSTNKISLNPANNFTETGQNTGIFELVLKVNATATTTTAGIVTTGVTLPASVSLRMQDHKVYAPVPSGATTGFNAAMTTTNFPSASVTLRNDDAVLGLDASVTLANGIKVKVTDPDRNLDTSNEDTLSAATVTVAVEGLSGIVNAVEFEETGDNNGIFMATLSDNRIPINIVSGPSTVTTTAINLNASMIASDPDITITYNDPFGSNNAAKTFTLVTSLAHSPGSLSGPAKVGVNDSFELELNEPDLNTNPSTVESYVVTFTGSTTNPVSFANGAADLLLRVKGTATTLSSPVTVTFIETGTNTGVFRASNVDMSVITGGSVSVSDGDSVSFRYRDFMESPATTSTATITIGKPGNAISVDRTTVPVPMPELSSVTSGGITFSTISADTVKVTIRVTDPTANGNSGSTDTVQITSGNVEVILASGTFSNQLTVNNGSPIATITLIETGVNTGVFERTIDLKPGSGFNLNQLNGARVKFTYKDVSTSVTLRLNDMAVSTNRAIVSNGDTFTVTISDADRNLDPSTTEEIEFWLTAKNSDVGNPQSFKAKETGANTGVFTKDIQVGKDIRVSDTASNDFARNIEIKVRERVSTDGTSGAIKERTVSVTTATGVVNVTPEVVGPGTKVTVSIRDFDLNGNPEGTETVTGSNDFVRIATDRTGVGTATPDAEETGASTGIFEFDLKLVPVGSAGAPSTMTPSTGSTEVTVPVLPGDIVAIRYTDAKDASGSKVTISRTFEVKSFDPEIKSNVPSVGVGQAAEITIADADANTDGDVVDSVQLKVTSTSDPVGFTISALETGANTGVFKATVTTSREVEAGSIMARTGDTVTIRYNDKYPADYADRIDQVVNPAKDFDLRIPVGASSGGTPETTTPSKPAVTDSQGRPLTQVLAGQQVVLSSKIQNNEGSTTAYAAIVEVRDSRGITVFLNWQTGTLQANDSTGIGLSWTPETPGTYTARVFVLSDLTNPRILSDTVTSTITVS